MIMSTKVNEKTKNSLSANEKAQAQKEIIDACTRRLLTPTNSVDLTKVKSIFNKYFNIDNPLIDINKGIEGQEFNPLMTTTWFGNYEETKELLALNADPLKSPNNISALHIAANNKRLTIIHLLLNKYPEIVNTKNFFGQTPLMYASEAGHIEIVKNLIEKYNADVQIKDNNGKIALDYAKEKKEYKIEAYLAYYDLNSKVEKKDHQIQSPRKAMKI